jgi:hypothetical protein
MRVLIVGLAIAFASVINAAETFPPLPQLPTGAPALAANPSVTKFTFAVAGDNRPAVCCAQPATVSKIINAMAADGPAFVLWDGDAIFGKDYTKAPGQYGAFLSLFAGFTAPVFNAPGNHELSLKGTDECVISKKKTKKIDEPDLSGHLLQTYITSMKAAPYGVFRYGNAAFVAINTDDTLDVKIGDCQYNGYVGHSQRKQLEATLDALSADNTVQHIVLFMHRPLEEKGSHQLEPLDGDWKSPYGKELRKFVDLVTNRKGKATKYPFPKITMVFASHDHRFAAFGTMSRTAPSSDGPTYLITGGAGAPLAGCSDGKPKDGAYSHYLLVNVDGPAISVAVRRIGDQMCQ